MKLDDIYINLYLCKVTMDVRKLNPLGQNRELKEKIMIGVTIVLLLILVIGNYI